MAEIMRLFHEGYDKLYSSEEEQEIVVPLSPEEINEYLPALTQQLSEITGDARNEDPQLMEKKLAKRLSTFDQLLLIGGRNGELIAYAGYEEIALLTGESLLYENAKMTRKAYQGKGLGRLLTKTAVENKRPDYFGLRTHNPAEILSVKRALPEIFFSPIDIPYASDTTLLHAIGEIAEQLHFKDINRETGVCKHAYEGKLGDFVVNQNHPDILKIEQKLKELNCLYENGDAVFIAGRVT